MFAWRVISFGAGIFLSLTSVLCADPVALTARDGSVEIAGDLRGFDGKYYRIETEYGELTLDAAKVRCGGPGCPEPGTFVAKARISAARPAGQSLIPALIETFASRKGLELQRAVSAGDGTTFELIDPSEGQSVAQFDMRLMTSAEAFADIVADEADIAISVREISPAEAQLARAAGRGILTASGRSTILALDALVPVVSVTNDVSSLSIQDFRDVLTGKTATWTQLTGGQGDLSVHVSRAAPGYVEALQRYLLRDAPLTAPNVVHHLDHRALDRTVSEDPFALGLSVYSEVRDAQPLALTGPCGVSAQATNGSLKTEDYPLTTPVFAYTPARRVAPFIAEFLTYANSPAAQPVVRRSGFVDQFPEAIPLETQGERLANAILRAGEETSLQELQRMVAAMAGRSRLSITFRFKDGSSQLDAQSRSNVQLLAAALQRGVFDGRALHFLGFSDGLGPASTNRTLAKSRADVVRNAVKQAVAKNGVGRVELLTDSFGEALPMACDEVEWGRSVNRRVEVWLE